MRISRSKVVGRSASSSDKGKEREDDGRRLRAKEMGKGWGGEMAEGEEVETNKKQRRREE